MKIGIISVKNIKHFGKGEEFMEHYVCAIPEAPFSGNSGLNQFFPIQNC